MQATSAQRTVGLVIGLGAFTYGLRVLIWTPATAPGGRTAHLIASMATAVGILCILLCCFAPVFNRGDSPDEPRDREPKRPR